MLTKLATTISASLIALAGCSAGFRATFYQTDNGFVRAELYYGQSDRPPVCCVEVHPENPDLVLSCEE